MLYIFIKGMTTLIFIINISLCGILGRTMGTRVNPSKKKLTQKSFAYNDMYRE